MKSSRNLEITIWTGIIVSLGTIAGIGVGWLLSGSRSSLPRQSNRVIIKNSRLRGPVHRTYLRTGSPMISDLSEEKSSSATASGGGGLGNGVGRRGSIITSSITNTTSVSSTGKVMVLAYRKLVKVYGLVIFNTLPKSGDDFDKVIGEFTTKYGVKPSSIESTVDFAHLYEALIPYKVGSGIGEDWYEIPIDTSLEFFKNLMMYIVDA
jgi:hypothetical protein